MQWNMDGGVREVEEERVVLVGRNEIDSFSSVTRGEGILVGRGFDDLAVAQQRQRWTGRGLTALLLPAFFAGALVDPPMSFE